MPQIDVPQLGEALKKESDKIESKGTFNAFAVRGIAKDTFAERTARAAEATAASTAKMKAILEKSGPVAFA